MAQAPKWTTWVGPETNPPSHAKTGPHGDTVYRPVTYESYEELPAAFRECLKIAYDSGLTAENLHNIFDLPIEWIEKAVKSHH